MNILERGRCGNQPRILALPFSHGQERLSPFHPESAAIQSGRLMLDRINKLISVGQDFAFETTFATKSYRNLVLRAKKDGYYITLLFFWLRSSDLAVKRVETCVKEGGHNIPEEVIRRRYENGLKNFFEIFKSIC